jgi:hypothetical protein
VTGIVDQHDADVCPKAFRIDHGATLSLSERAPAADLAGLSAVKFRPGC